MSNIIMSSLLPTLRAKEIHGYMPNVLLLKIWEGEFDNSWPSAIFVNDVKSQSTLSTRAYLITCT